MSAGNPVQIRVVETMIPEVKTPCLISLLPMNACRKPGSIVSARR